MTANSGPAPLKCNASMVIEGRSSSLSGALVLAGDVAGVQNWKAIAGKFDALTRPQRVQ
jgi:hypothetical protein